MPVSSPIAKPFSISVNSIKRLRKDAGQNCQPLQQLQPPSYLYIRMQSTYITLYTASVDIPILLAKTWSMARSAVTAGEMATLPTSVRSHGSHEVMTTTQKTTLPPAKADDSPAILACAATP